MIRLIPIWLGHDPDYEEHEGDAPLLVDAGTERSRALLAAERQGLLTEAGEDVEGDQRATDEGDEDREGLEGGSGALRSLGNENRALIEVDEVMAGKVVGFPEWVSDILFHFSVVFLGQAYLVGSMAWVDGIALKLLHLIARRWSRGVRSMGFGVDCLLLLSLVFGAGIVGAVSR